jgi:hypothetical protein
MPFICMRRWNKHGDAAQAILSCTAPEPKNQF